MTATVSGPDTSVARLTELADYVIPFALRAACDLRVADHLAGGPRPVTELAAATGTRPRALLRLLRALAMRGVFTEGPAETFALTPLAEPMRSDHPRSLREAYPLIPADVRAWGELGHSLRTGSAAFDEANGVDYWTHMRDHAADGARFDASQRAVTRREIKALLPAYDWGGFGTLVDVGGGNGAFLGAILAAFPDLRGILFDQPHVVSSAGPVLADLGVSDRCTVRGGDFRSEVPAGGDGYLIKRALYDLDDPGAEELLRAVRAAIRPDGRLLVIEPVLEPGDAFDWGKLYDVLLMVMRGGGSRSEPELTALLARTGFRLERILRPRGLPIVEARPI